MTEFAARPDGAMTYVMPAGGSAQRGVQLGARGDAELREPRIQVRAHRPMTEVEARPDLAIGETRGCEAGDLQLLRRQLVEDVDPAMASRFASCSQLLLGAVREVTDADRVEQVPGRTQLGPRLRHAALPPQPRSVGQRQAGPSQRPVL